jgi:hypothetical protein
MTYHSEVGRVKLIVGEVWFFVHLLPPYRLIILVPSTSARWLAKGKIRDYLLVAPMAAAKSIGSILAVESETPFFIDSAKKQFFHLFFSSSLFPFPPAFQAMIPQSRQTKSHSLRN